MKSSETEKSLALPLLAGLVGLSVAAVGAVFYWTSDDDQVAGSDPAISGNAPPSAENPSAVQPPAAAPGDGRTDDAGRSAALPRPPVSESPAVTTQAPSPKPPADTGDDATSQVESVAESSAPKPEKVRELKKFLRDQYNQDTQRLAIRNLRKIIKDEEYAELMADELRNPDQPEFVRNALVVDVESRSRIHMLPVMAELATGPEHPLKDQATTYLHGTLGDAFTTDPEALQEAIKAHINRKTDGF